MYLLFLNVLTVAFVCHYLSVWSMDYSNTIPFMDTLFEACQTKCADRPWCTGIGHARSLQLCYLLGPGALASGTPGLFSCVTFQALVYWHRARPVSSAVFPSRPWCTGIGHARSLQLWYLLHSEENFAEHGGLHFNGHIAIVQKVNFKKMVRVFFLYA